MQLSKQFLSAICWFGAAAGSWLALMENILRHEGYGGRTAIAACIVLQSLATLFFLAKPTGIVIRAALAAGAAGIIWLGASAISNTLGGSHFEGFAVVIGAALIVQGLITVGVITGEGRGFQSRP